MSVKSRRLGSETLGDFVDHKYAPWARVQLHEEDIGQQLKADFPDLMAQPLNALTAELIGAWSRDRKDENTQPLVVSRMLGALQQCLAKAVEWGAITHSPLQGFNPDDGAHYLVELFVDGNGHRYLREGWSNLGAGWTWTSGARAVIELPYVKCDGDFMLKLGVVGILKSAVHSFQRITIEVNDAVVGKVLCRGPTFYEFFVPGELLSAQKRVQVVLLLPDADFAHDSTERKDTRHLSLRVARIELQLLKKARSLPKFEAPDPVRSTRTDPRPMLQEMASLGFNCEFGFVQRQAGAEPMGLFRWTSAPIDQLILALDRRLEGMNDPNALDIRVDEQGEYIAEIRTFGFWYHTFVNRAHGIAPERIRRNEFLRIGMLSKSLIGELTGQTKLFVFQDADQSKLADIRRLVMALNKYGKNTLLWLVSGTQPSLIGTARQIGPGLIQGYVSGFQTGDIQPISPHADSWVAAACRAHRIWTLARLGKAQEPIPSPPVEPRQVPAKNERGTGRKIAGAEIPTRPA